MAQAYSGPMLQNGVTREKRKGKEFLSIKIKQTHTHMLNFNRYSQLRCFIGRNWSEGIFNTVVVATYADGSKKYANNEVMILACTSIN